MNLTHLSRVSRCLLPAIALSVSFVHAQTNRGGISGNVADQSGGMIPNAAVTIVNVGTNETRRLTTSDKGSFMQENLDPVTYKIEVSAPGFKKAVLENVKVDTSTVVTANVTLEAGDVATEVTVTANAAVVNTESGTLGQTITSRMLNDTPLPTRSVLDLAITIGNVTGDVGTSDPQLTGGAPLPGYNLQANGGRAGSTNLLADGINNRFAAIVKRASKDQADYSKNYGKYQAEVLQMREDNKNALLADKEKLAQKCSEFPAYLRHPKSDIPALFPAEFKTVYRVR